MNPTTRRWSVRRVQGQWRVYDRGVWWDSFDSLPEAHTAATQNAVADTLYQPGGLTLLAQLKAAHNDWADWAAL